MSQLDKRFLSVKSKKVETMEKTTGFRLIDDNLTKQEVAVVPGSWLSGCEAISDHSKPDIREAEAIH